MFKFYGVYLRKSPRHNWELNSTQTDEERALFMARLWRDYGGDWAIIELLTDNPVNASDQMGWKYKSAELKPDIIHRKVHKGDMV
jgi:hypothetical protein